MSTNGDSFIFTNLPFYGNVFWRRYCVQLTKSANQGIKEILYKNPIGSFHFFEIFKLNHEMGISMWYFFLSLFAKFTNAIMIINKHKEGKQNE